MLKRVYVGVDGVARKVKKIYLGIDGVARKVKRGYIGVGGVARPFWTGGEITYYGTATSLSQTRYAFAAASVGDYTLFAGGTTSFTTNTGKNYAVTTVDAYDKSLTRTTPTALSTARYYLSGTTVGGYALFAGGTAVGSSSYTASKVVNSYDASLTRGAVTSLSVARFGMSATTVGDNALFAGGETNDRVPSAVVDAYSSSLTRTVPTSLNESWNYRSATSVGDYALIGGGWKQDTDDYFTSEVEVYNSSLSKFSSVHLSTERGGGSRDSRIAAVTVGKYALFAGGANYRYSDSGIKVDTFDESLTLGYAESLSSGTTGRATTLDNFALIADTGSMPMNAYDESLTKTTPVGAIGNDGEIAATTVGNYALFADDSAVSVYTIN